MEVSVLLSLVRLTSTILDIRFVERLFHIQLLQLRMSKLSRQVSPAYSLSSRGFRLFDPLKEPARGPKI